MHQFERNVEAVAPKYINSLVELIANGIETLERQQSSAEDGINGNASTGFPHQGGQLHHGSIGGGLINASSGLIWDGIQSVESCKRHFIALLRFIRDRKEMNMRKLETETLIAKKESEKEDAIDPDWSAVNIAAAMGKMGI